MLDFLSIKEKTLQSGIVEIQPDFNMITSKDLMIRGGDFYAIWDENSKLWSKSTDTVVRLIDDELRKYVDDNIDRFPKGVFIDLMRKASTGSIDKWLKYVKHQCWDNWEPLDEKIIFSNTETTREDYASKKLKYPLTECPIDNWDKLISKLYEPAERMKIEWAIGAIFNGDAKKIHKFLVMYGAPGTGKSTIINIMEKLFEGYCSGFDSKALGSRTNQFALEPFKSNPLIAIEHDGDLSRIEDNTRLNSVVSHENLVINEKNKAQYTSRFKCMLVMGTNKPVKITDAKSGIIRRLIDVKPTGDKLTPREYRKCMKGIDHELGGIAWHCIQVYENNKDLYDDYIPKRMMGATNDIYNFVLDKFETLEKMSSGITLSYAFDLFNDWAEKSKIPYSTKKSVFKEELKNYYIKYVERGTDENGKRCWHVYSGLKHELFEGFEEAVPEPKPVVQEEKSWIIFDGNGQISPLDEALKDCLAQYTETTKDGTIKPKTGWAYCKSRLEDIRTCDLHYVKPPLILVVLDFDIKDENGNKNLELNIKEASKYPPTYAEVSQGGNGLHLHYWYDGDVENLEREISKDVEIKVYYGGNALRRRLTKYNTLPIAKYGGILPAKKESKKKMVNEKIIKDNEHLRNTIIKNLNRGISRYTTDCIDYINNALNAAYDAGIDYDMREFSEDILAMAAGSTNQKEKNINTWKHMKLCSDKYIDSDNFIGEKEPRLVFFDFEVFINKIICCWKYHKDPEVHVMVDPTPADMDWLLSNLIVGYNNKNYDNHIAHAIRIGYSTEEVYDLSQRIIVAKDPKAKFRVAYGYSYTDILDFTSKKQSLKKYEIELGLYHDELGLRWDEPLPEDKVDRCIEYCKHDVINTEAVFEARQGDWFARKALADICNNFGVKASYNDSTNVLSQKLIFKNDMHPQTQFIYTDLSTIFPGYEFKDGVSWYKGIKVGEGGWNYCAVGVYFGDSLTADVASEHPHAMKALNIFGEKYTKIMFELVETRLDIKHGDFESASKRFGGAFAPYLKDKDMAKMLSGALKIVINSIYGQTFQKEKDGYVNRFRDVRNVDNIVAKYGALFMINLKEEVEKRGFTVIHCKTDSIKIHKPTPEIVKFVYDYGQSYGLTFEVEDQWERFCLMNKAAYAGKTKAGVWESEGWLTGVPSDYIHESEWHTKTTKVSHPYVKKKLFDRDQEIVWSDICETKAVTRQDAIYLDFNEGNEEENNYSFVGKTGLFVPVKPGCGGGLMKGLSKDGKYGYIQGTKGYRWKEATVVEACGGFEEVDLSYFDAMVDDVYDDISKACGGNDVANQFLGFEYA